MSIDGTFKDVYDTVEYWYYKPIEIVAIKPHMGPKDGGTTVQVYGKGFKDFGEESVCSFGVKSSQATVNNEGYLTCVAPPSDVIGRPMPFAVSLNG